MINHLTVQGNDIVTSELLSLKMNMPVSKIDESLSILFTKGYIEFVTKGDKTVTSLRPLKRILFKTFEKTIYTDDEVEKNEQLDKIRENIFHAFEQVFERSLSPVEISRIDNWIRDEVPEDVILDSLKDASKRGKLSIQYIDRIIVNKLKEEDRAGNDLRI